jgi:RNA recognition motif-containing protein
MTEKGTAKERRSARRAAERGVELKDSAMTVERGVELKDSAMTAKERRLARRAAQREEKQVSGAAEEERGAAPKELDTTMTAKERRLARRAAQREEMPAKEVADGPEKEMTKKKEKRAPLVLFVGQLSYKTTAAEIEQHFRAMGDLGDSTMRIRLLTKPGHKPSAVPVSRGMAFIEVDDPRTLHKCLELHHTRLGGRVINVEKSSGGGKAKAAQNITQARQKQSETMKCVVSRILSTFVQQNHIREGEFDEDAIRVLNKFDGALVEKALMNFIETKDRDELRNPSAYLVHLTHRLAFDNEEEGITEAFKEAAEKQRIRILGEDAASSKKKSDVASKSTRGKTKRAGQDSGTKDHAKKKPKSSNPSKDDEPITGAAGTKVQQSDDSVPLHRVFSSLRTRGGSMAARRGGRGESSEP